MKNMRKLFAMVLAVIMVMSLATTAFAATINKTQVEVEGVEKDKFTGPASITVTLPNTTNAATANNTYKIYKVFDATTAGTNISYTLVEGKTTAPAGFSVDTAGNVTYTGTGTGTELTAEDIAAIAAYVTAADLVATVETTKDDTEFTVSNLPYGYYYITTTTGSVVTVDSTKPNAQVRDKNVVPKVDKKITGASSVDEDGKKALAQIGTDVTYTGYVTVGFGVENYVYHDTMKDGLTFKPDSLEVKIQNGSAVSDDNYTLATTGLANNETFTVSFDNEYIASLEKDTVIEITYKATINTNALTADPENNTAYLSYGHEDDVDTTPTVSTEVYNAKFTVTKQDGDEEPLAGAGFVIAKTVADTSEGAAEGATKTVYYKLTGNVVSWVDSITDATEYVSDEDGNVQAFIGLANGTYTLIEKTVPAGYNKADDYNFTIKEHDYEMTNLAQATLVTNNAGTELPSTGGMGTTLFYVFGAILMVVAAVLLVTKRRMNMAE